MAFINIFKRDDDADKTTETNDAAKAALVYAAVGGPDNIKSLDYCATRLRFKLNDASKVDEEACKNAGSLGVVVPEDEEEGSIHVVMGTQASKIASELQKLL